MIQVRALIGMLALMLLNGSGAAQPKIPASSRPVFQQEWLVPYFRSGPGGEARRYLQARNPKQAAVLLRRYLIQRRAPQKQQARFLLAYALLESKEQPAIREAAQLFSALIKDYPLLQDYCRFFAARAFYQLKDFSKTEALAAAIDSSSALFMDAQLLQGDGLRALHREQEAASIWRTYLQRYPGGKQVSTVHFYIAEALERSSGQGKTRDQALSEEAMNHYQQVLIKAPLSRRRAVVEKRLQALAKAIPEGQRKIRLQPWQRYEQAVVLFRANRNKQSEAAFAALLQEKEISATLRCKASFYLAKSVFKQRQRARALPFYLTAENACRKANEPELVLKSLYDGARGLFAKQEYKQAIARFGRIETEFKEHSYADDARLWAAEIWEKQQEKREVIRLLSSLPRLYPQGDMVREALWRLARMSYLEQDYAGALRYLEQTLRTLGRARYYYAQGQAHYWKARLLDELKQPAKAREAYEQCIREYPLSYYALLAFNRLRERHITLYRQLFKELISPVGRGQGKWSFAPRSLFAQQGFLRGVELARLGFDEQAARELAKQGLSIKKGGQAEELWLSAVLYDRAGLWKLAHQVPRSIETTYKRSYPLQENYRRWTIAYPKAFYSLTTQAARQAGISWELVTSIMREESGFDPTIESYANAVGLMQLILPTARAAGSQHKLEVTRERLHDPVVNIKLGATYLGFLKRAFGVIPLTISGYNAGEGATFRWVKQLGAVPLDELIERIPYDQTRRYTKRVLSTLFVYSVLYKQGAGRVPRLGQLIPQITAQRLREAKK